MPLTLRARTLLKWNSHLGSTYRASSRRRKALGWHLWGYAYFLACLIFFDRMVLSSCSLNCPDLLIFSPKKEGAKDKCNLNGWKSTIPDLCGCLNQQRSHEKQKQLLERLHLDFCDTLPFHEHLAFLANATEDKCTEKLLGIVNADCVASQWNSKFEGIIERIDCNVEYSVRWKCKDCKEAYKEWICTNLVLPKMIGDKEPCKQAACKRVLQRCPYFLPFSDNQWSGQSAFECDTEKKDSSQCVDVPEMKNNVKSNSGS